MKNIINYLKAGFKAFFTLIFEIFKNLSNLFKLDLTKVTTEFIEFLKIAILGVCIVAAIAIILPFALFIVPIYLYMTKEDKTTGEPKKKKQYKSVLNITHNRFNYDTSGPKDMDAGLSK